ncbi:MAG: hypothetical protein CM15mP102_02320 [Flavobacteriales bacterium]|nr:MAG: hypothetical protein CM15mP102_02320 [Flavobacteriales bacterium]
MYPEEIVKPMKLELTNSGFSELTSSEDVKSALKKEGTTLIVVNSVCGCAARNARPGVIMSLSNESKPDNLVLYLLDLILKQLIRQEKKCFHFLLRLHLLLIQRW